MKTNARGAGVWNFTGAVRRSVESRNWYAALSVALLLPDICGRLENPRLKSQVRYAAWFERWLSPLYTVKIGNSQSVFMSGDDCYALRCAICHEGRDNISEQRARKVLSSFRFSTPHGAIMMHRVKSNDVLQLQVDRFALEVCDAVESWLAYIAGNVEVQGRLDELAVIYKTEDGIPGILDVRAPAPNR